MDIASRVNALSSTTFCGRRFSRQQILQVVDTISAFGRLSRQELAFTICEHLDWKTAGGELKVNSALELLDKFESEGLCRPPPVHALRKRGPDKIENLTLPEPNDLSGDLAALLPISVRVVDDRDDRQRFNALLAKHHYLGYKRPFGAHLRYFILDKNGRELGLLLYAASAWSLAARDQWLSWEKKHRVKRLHLVVCNSRFLIFPWVNVHNLATKSLALVGKQLTDDWYARYNYRPVLIETFVERKKFLGTCYQAANWIKVGETTGRGRCDSLPASKEAIKDIYVQPLVANFRDVLLRGESTAETPRALSLMPDKLWQIHDHVLLFWTKVAPLIRDIARDFDQQWRVKHRVIDSMLLVLLIFRLVATRAKHGYGTTIDELWDNCRKQGVFLPQKNPIAASAFAVARRKLNEDIFKIINARVLKDYEALFDREDFRFHGHRLYAIDGTKINLPRPLVNEGYVTPGASAHYPQGLFSALYRLKAQVPADFMLTHDFDERQAALAHLQCLAPDDVVVYDRGYFSYGLLHAHAELGIHALFRLNSITYPVIREFMESDRVDQVVIIEPKSRERLSKIRKNYGDIEIKPLAMRLIKYQIADTMFYLGTTLIGDAYPHACFQDAYHGRWGIEELYKISKTMIAIEEFHARSERGVKQELYANMALITLNRIFTNHTDDNLKSKPLPQAQRQITNFKNSMAAIARNLESLLLSSAQALGNSLQAVLSSLGRRHQKMRPMRSYPRMSKKPRSPWQSRKQDNKLAA